MENLSRIAQGIFLGNGEVWNFLDYAVNRTCGGILYNTQRNDFLGANLINNFNGGFCRRYDYDKIKNTEIYTFNSVFPSHGRGGNIGELYSVPDDIFNSSLNFISDSDFIVLNDYIRENNIILNKYKNSYNDVIPKSYAGEVDDKYNKTYLPQSNIGEYYDVNRESPIYTKYDLESFGNEARNQNLASQIIVEGAIGTDYNHRKYTEFTISKDHPIIYNDITSKVSERTFSKLKLMEDVAIEKRKSIRRHHSSSERFLELATQKVTLKDNTTFYGLFNEYTTEGTEIPLIPSINNYGLEIYYKSEREKYNSKLRGIKYPWDNNGFWTFKDQYGVNINISDNETSDYYTVGGKNDFNGEVSISNNGGAQVIFNSVKNTTKYNFFQESEKGAYPSSINDSGNVSDGSSVGLSDYDGASRLLRKTNELFRQAKIKSLINRFHTTAQEVNSELISSFDNEFGLSRGRNLIKEKYEGKQGGDTTSGYDNPYCRVWTAHHQYSTLKDRIRPFVNENGQSISLSETQSNYGKMRAEGGLTRLNDYSVLNSNGFLRITPTHESGKLVQSEDHLKNYMFSIENLAWRDVTMNENSSSLSKEQRGPNGGRIMWFPPYNLKFTENINVNWNANNFIGRGEEIYTYTNTVRSGTLDFTLLIDHPSILNKWRGTSVEVEEKEKRERDLLRFFAGCSNLNDEVTPEKEQKESKKVEEENMKQTLEPTFYSKDIGYVMFFPNDFSALDYIDGYITTGKGDSAKTISKMEYVIDEILMPYNMSGGGVTERDNTYKNEVLQPHNLTSNGFVASKYEDIIKRQIFGDYENIEIHYLNDLVNIKTNFRGDNIFGFPSENCTIDSIKIKGFASSHGYESNNQILCNRRRTFIQKLMEQKCQELSEVNNEYVKEIGSTIAVPDIDGREDVNSVSAKIARAAYAVIRITWKEENVAQEGSLVDGGGYSVMGKALSAFTETEEIEINTNIVSTQYYAEDEYTYDNEYLYFSEIRGDKLIYKNILDKVRYFDPAYHSITPEGFNARLTFLQQCTRQGPTNAVSSGRLKGVEKDENGNIIDGGSPDYLKFAGNLAFGRAPYCILRIGDFFNTKICIDSMSINYDNNGSVQWDLNPEGVGVQPMYANISISFKFLGGQDITRPIERLQNAVTANYYANASVYNRHSDNNKFYYDALEDSNNSLTE